MAAMRRLKALVLLFAFLILFVGAITITTTQKAEAIWGCCIYVMYCTIDEPIYCWCECIPVPCF